MANVSIVLTVCEQHQVSPAAFFGPGRTKKLSRARSAAIEALMEAGFGTHATARLIKRDPSTVVYWKNRAVREKRVARCSARETRARLEAQRQEHLANLRGTLAACIDELRRLDPGFLAKVLS